MIQSFKKKTHEKSRLIKTIHKSSGIFSASGKLKEPQSESDEDGEANLASPLLLCQCRGFTCQSSVESRPQRAWTEAWIDGVRCSKDSNVLVLTKKNTTAAQNVLFQPSAIHHSPLAPARIKKRPRAIIIYLWSNYRRSFCAVWYQQHLIFLTDGYDGVAAGCHQPSLWKDYETLLFRFNETDRWEQITSREQNRAWVCTSISVY